MNLYFRTLKKYAVFSGCASRKEYWTFQLVNLILSYGVLNTIDYLISIERNTVMLLCLNLLSHFISIYLVVAIVPTIAVAIRRMHDVGRSGWWSIVPIVSLVLSLKPGQIGENKYGRDPREQR